jgi:CHAP domain/Putative peptidoglycan binding domain
MTTAAAVIENARADIGFREGPNNATPWGIATGYPNQPWCGSWADRQMAETGMRVTRYGGPDSDPSSVYTPSGANRYKALGRWTPRNGTPLPGDLVFYDWGGSQNTGATDHVGLLEALLPDGNIQTIEGNTSAQGVNGSQSNGDGVWRRIRDRRHVVGFGRPLYVGTLPTPPVQPPTVADWDALHRWLEGRKRHAAHVLWTLVQLPPLAPGLQNNLHVVVLQQALNLVAEQGLSEDGDYGPRTAESVRNLQRMFGVPADGFYRGPIRDVLVEGVKAIAEGRA